jgi:phage-related protein
MKAKKIHARFYQLPSGKKPVREWLMQLDGEDRRIAGFDVQTVEFGWPIGMPVCKPLGDGLWEVRSNFSGGIIGRIIFCLVNNEMVLLHGFIKKTQKTPLAELALSRKRMREIS